MGVSQLLTVQDVAKLLQLSDQTVRRYIKQGRLRARKINKRDIRLVDADVQEFMRQPNAGTANE
jgi:excisionase family DNA binding protein